MLCMYENRGVYLKLYYHMIQYRGVYLKLGGKYTLHLHTLNSRLKSLRGTIHKGVVHIATVYCVVCSRSYSVDVTLA